jgi:hypothetical protein
MENFDLVQALGNATCNGATSFLASHQACTITESWNFGAILIVGAFLTAAFLLDRAQRTTRRRENYYW